MSITDVPSEILLVFAATNAVFPEDPSLFDILQVDSRQVLRDKLFGDGWAKEAFQTPRGSQDPHFLPFVPYKVHSPLLPGDLPEAMKYPPSR
ncbi:MAG TPA: hypothetical protein VEQ18_00605 [Candidatus Nitrosocosmicus sp.]|nr:hypothetical protein [Candidatus Nitrosocosmicus sp.]